MEKSTRIDEVRTVETQGGNTRYVVRDADGEEYSTFREAIGEQAQQLRGRRVHLQFHKVQRGQYTNVYVDKLEPLDSGEAPARDTDVQEAAWRTAVEAAPWLVGKPGQEVEPEELYDKLKPFEARVAQDIQETQRPEEPPPAEERDG